MKANVEKGFILSFFATTTVATALLALFSELKNSVAAMILQTIGVSKRHVVTARNMVSYMIKYTIPHNFATITKVAGGAFLRKQSPASILE